ncbi:unnamed protein product, partial [marine sediment metagenome]
NFTHGDMVRPYLIAPKWAEGVKKAYGEASPFYQARVLGQFPKQGTDTLIPLQDIEDAQARWYDMEDGSPKQMGVDVAWYGDDDTAFAIRYGGKVLPLEVMHGRDPMEVAGRAMILKRDHELERVKVDMIGIGAGVYARLKEQTKGIVPIDSARKSADAKKFVNFRAQMWAGFRLWLSDEEVGLPPDPELAAQLSSVKYKYNSRGQLVIESKEDMKKRGMASPNKADAVVYAFADVGGIDLSDIEQPTAPSKWTDYEGGSRWRR